MNLFVYGSLRPGHYNFQRLFAGGVIGVRPAQSTGRLYHYMGSTRQMPMFPVACFDEPGTIAGDLIQLDSIDHQFEIEQVRWMELGAGYEERQINVALENSHEVEAYAYHWPHGSAHRGEWIPSGDWTLEYAAYAR